MRKIKLSNTMHIAKVYTFMGLPMSVDKKAVCGATLPEEAPFVILRTVKCSECQALYPSVLIKLLGE